MEVPGRDVTADVDSDDTEPTGDARRDDDRGVDEKVEQAPDEVKDAVTPDDGDGSR
jgi:hypothetical protein